MEEAKEDAKSALDPVLISEAQDRIYAANGLEYAKYIELTNAQTALGEAQEKLNEVSPDLDDVQYKYYEKQWQRDENAKTPEEWLKADAELQDLKTRLDSL